MPRLFHLQGILSGRDGGEGVGCAVAGDGSGQRCSTGGGGQRYSYLLAGFAVAGDGTAPLHAFAAAIVFELQHGGGAGCVVFALIVVPVGYIRSCGAFRAGGDGNRILNHSIFRFSLCCQRHTSFFGKVDAVRRPATATQSDDNMISL